MRTALVLQVLVLCLPICLFSNFLFFFSFFPFSLLFAFWPDRSPTCAFVPSYVSSSARSSAGLIVRLSSRLIVPSFDRSFVGAIICWPVRSDVRLSLLSFFGSVVQFFFPPSFLATSVLFLRSFFFPSPYRSFLGMIVRPSI